MCRLCYLKYGYNFPRKQKKYGYNFMHLFISMKTVIERYQEAREENNCPLLNPISEAKVRILILFVCFVV